MKTAVYVRVSTEEQAKEGFSIKAQQQKLKDFTKIKDWELHDLYIDDGKSGKNITGRPEMNRLITDIMKGKVKNVLVFKLDRLTRSTKDLIMLMDLFKEHDCGFNSLSESIDTTTASGRMFLKILGIFAEFERENLIERITVAMEKKVNEGYTIASYIVPYAYQREKGNRNITINEEEAKIVKEIYNLYLKKHKSLNAIARELNLRKIKSNTNSDWSASSIKYILSNPLYAGKVRYSLNDKKRYFEAEGKHEGIISAEIFNEVQNKLAKMQRTIKKRPKEENYYIGSLKCGVCGDKMTTHGHYLKDKNNNDVYYCSYICKQKIKGQCNSKSISHNKVDFAFNEYIKNLKDFTVEDEVEINKSNENSEDITSLKQEYEAFLSKLLKKEQSIMQLYINDEINFNEYNKMQELTRVQRKAYEEKINELETSQEINVGLNPEDIIINLKENWELLTNGEKMQFLQTYIEAIYVINEPDKDNQNKNQAKVKKLEYNRN